MKSFFKKSKKEEKKEKNISRTSSNGARTISNSSMNDNSHGSQHRDSASSSQSHNAKRLPKNFASRILDLELKIDSGHFDIDTIDNLMQLYSVSEK